MMSLDRLPGVPSSEVTTPSLCSDNGQEGESVASEHPIAQAAPSSLDDAEEPAFEVVETTRELSPEQGRHFEHAPRSRGRRTDLSFTDLLPVPIKDVKGDLGGRAEKTLGVPTTGIGG